MNYFVIPGIKTYRELPKKACFFTKERIIKVVCDHYKLTEAALKARSRKESCRHARQVAMYLMKKETQMYLREIGETFGFQHDNVLHSTRTIQDLVDTDPRMKNLIHELTENI